ncbi:MAG TPA: tyrosine-type recombinase/integrase [Terriglobales bacterium]|jgi:integrase|nr:tyrosine-type recombinase/integrase [Terriglobales bacterium]
MGRHQTGYIFESASGAFHVRYYTTEIVDGQPKRVQKSRLLCHKDEKHFSATCKAVKLLRDEFMRKVNVSQANEEDMRISDFWEQRYLPFAEQNMKPATVYGYKQIWSQHLKGHFGGMTLQSYRAHVGSQFLLGLTRTQGRRTLNHIRSLASGIFTHAINEGRLETNPWHDVKILGKVRPPAGTAHYTLEEAENIISALVDHVDAQLVMALSFFTGLRPSEIAGLQWGDFDQDAVHIRRAVVRGIVGTPKTLESVATLPLLPQVQVPLELWRQASQKKFNGDLPLTSWLFSNQAGNPADLKEMVRRVIRPTLQKAGLEWKSLYAGRRGAGTAIIDLTNGNYAAAQELLRHKHMTTTLQFYKKRTESALASGMKALAAAAGRFDEK